MCPQLSKKSRPTIPCLLLALLAPTALAADDFTVLREVRDEVWIDGPDGVQPGVDRNFPDVAVDSQGRAIHVWQAFNDALGDRNDIFVRRFDPDDSSLESPQLVNTVTEDDQRQARVAVRTDGAFFVIWQSDDYDVELDADRRNVRGQFFDSTGTPQGSEQLINQVSTDLTTDLGAVVAALDNGTFVVVWHSKKGLGTDSQPCDPGTPTGCGSLSIQARRIGTNGVVSGAQFQVNVDPDRGQLEPAIASTADGGFFVAWHSDNNIDSDSSSRSVQGRRFNAAGNPVTGEFQINTTTTGAQDSPEMARNAVGQVLIVFESPNLINTRRNVRARLFDAGGNPVGNDFFLSTFESEEHQYDPRVAGGTNYFLTAWTADSGIGSDEDRSINGRIVRDSAEFDGGQFQINVSEPGAQAPAAVGAQGDLAVVTWRTSLHPFESNDDAIFARGYEFCLFCDDWECSDQRRWSREVGN